LSLERSHQFVGQAGLAGGVHAVNRYAERARPLDSHDGMG
jgi:hypothetical protein